MSTSLQILSNVIEQNRAADPAVQKLLRYFAMRSMPNTAVLSSAAAGSATTTTTAVSGLTISNGVGFNGNAAVVGGRTYEFEIWAPATTDGTAGMKLTLDGGTATFSSFAAVGYAYTASAIATVASTAAATAVVNAATAYTHILVKGTFTASKSGTFAPALGVNTAGTAAQLLAGSYCKLVEIPLANAP